MNNPHTPPKDLELSYRAGAVVVLFKDLSHVFIAERFDHAGAWQLPQGGLDAGENPLEGALRELAEETGITSDQVELFGETPFWTWYDWPEEAKQKMLGRKPDLAHLKGARHKWFFFHFIAKDESINLAQAADKEFIDWRWATPEDIMESVIHFRQESYRQAFAYFEEQLLPALRTG